MNRQTLEAKLNEQNIKVIARNSSDDEWFVTYSGTVHTLTFGYDIEVNVVNGDFRGSVYTNMWDMELNEDTIAYRILATLRGDKIDYTLRINDNRPTPQKPEEHAGTIIENCDEIAYEYFKLYTR